MKPIKFRTLPYIIFSFAHLFVFSVIGQSQSNCPNSDFSLGNFSYWEGYSGDFLNPALHKGFVLNRHTIIQSPATYDPNTCYGLNPIPSGQKYSVRLGNDIGLQAEQLKYSINVTEETNLFIYKYAVVLEDQPHDPDQQPNFTIEVVDSSGKVIDPVCGSYFVYAHQGIPAWHSCKDVVWQDWTTVGIDLSQYLGQMVSIIFTTRDCALGIHFGYAYLSAYCSRLQLAFGFCPGDTIATVTAPSGFSYLWSNGDTTQSSTIHNPFSGMVERCVLTSGNGCKVTIRDTFSLNPGLVNADFDYPHQNCVGTGIQFHDFSTINPNVPTIWKWDFGDGSPLVTNIQNPIHIYDSVGTFNVTLVVTCDGSCPDTVTKSLEIYSIPEIHFTISSPCDENGRCDTLYFDEQVQLKVAPGYDHYIWNTGDTTNSIKVTDEGWYNVTINNKDICFTTDSVMMLHCIMPLRLPNAFSPDNDGNNDLFRPVVVAERITTFRMLIFDKWGRNVFETEDILRGWDGTIDGKQAPSGVYAYTLLYGIDTMETKKMKGTVTLVR